MADGAARARADRIREKIPITEVLAGFGYQVRAADREQQFCCNLHGDGRDNKPSARVYPETQQWYCFACDMSRDAIATVQANMALDFWGAIKWLETKFNLPAFKWEGPREPTALEVITSTLPDSTFEDEHQRLCERLERMTQDRDLPMAEILTFWEAADKVAWQVKGDRGDKGGPWSEQEGRAVIVKLQERLLKAYRGEAD